MRNTTDKKAVCRECGAPVEVLPVVVGEYRSEVAPPYCEACQGRRQEAAERAREEAREAQRQEWRRQIDLLLARAGVPKRYLACTLANFRGEVPRPRPAYLTGPPGVGKTHLAVGYLREEILARGPGAGRFVRAVDLLAEIRATYGDRAVASEQEVERRYTIEAPFLVLDDMGTEKLSEWVQEKLYAILDWRYGQELPTLITANLTLAALAGHYRTHGERLASRIAGMGEEVELRGRDRRWEPSRREQWRKGD